MSRASAGLASLPAAVRRRHDRLRDDGERGTSLMELVVGMMIMTIFMGIFTSAIIMLYRSANKSQSINVSSGQLTQAFVRLDETVRYAAAISTPGLGSGTGDWYVELRTTNTGSEVCTQLRTDVTTGALQRRSWTVTSSVAGTPTAWVQVATGLTNAGVASGNADQPFVLKAASGSVTYQRLAFVLVAASGGSTSATTSRSAYTFTALNSSGATSSGVCAFTGWRP